MTSEELEQKFIALRNQQGQIIDHGSTLNEEATERWKPIDAQLDQLRNDYFELFTAIERKYRGITESTARGSRGVFQTLGKC